MNLSRRSKIQVIRRLIHLLVISGIAVFLLLVFFVAGLLIYDYQNSTQYIPQNFETELNTNREKWESSQITHYQLTVDFDGYGIFEQMPWTLEVRDNNIVSVTDTQGNKIQDFYSDRDFTISGIFDDIQSRFQSKAPVIRVRYNSFFGYPEDVFINPYREPCCQDYEVIIRGFQVLP